MKLTEEQYGRKYGYPPCCIKWFTTTFRRYSQARKHRYFRSNAANTMGYIPCPKCAPAVKAVIGAFKREVKLIFPSIRRIS